MKKDENIICFLYNTFIIFTFIYLIIQLLGNLNALKEYNKPYHEISKFIDQTNAVGYFDFTEPKNKKPHNKFSFVEWQYAAVPAILKNQSPQNVIICKFNNQQEFVRSIIKKTNYEIVFISPNNEAILRAK